MQLMQTPERVLRSEPGLVPAAHAAATINSAAVDNGTMGAENLLVLGHHAATAAAHTILFTVQHSPDNSAWADATLDDGTTSAEVLVAASTATSPVRIRVRCSRLDRYIRLQVVTVGASTTVASAMLLFLGIDDSKWSDETLAGANAYDLLV